MSDSLYLHRAYFNIISIALIGSGILKDSRLVKEVVFGEMKEKPKRGRPKTEWLDDVKEWCN